MLTTALFVEIIVIGVGVFTAIALTLSATMGAPGLLDKETTALILAFPFLALSYVLGIIVDRFADYVYDLFAVPERKCQPFASLDDYHRARRLIKYRSEAMWQHLEYTRSRLRICRGWSLNCVCLLVAANLWIWSQARPLAWQAASSGVVSGMLVLVFFGCLFTFRALGKSYREQVFETYKLLQGLVPVTRSDAAGDDDGPTARPAVVAAEPAAKLGKGVMK